MNAPLTKNQLGFSLGNLSYIGPSYEEPYAPVVKPAQGILGRLAAKFTEWRHRRQVVEEMALMTDRELSDIGLTRHDLARVFDPDFAADHQRGRDYIAF